jgi:hypothetical protein
MKAIAGLEQQHPGSRVYFFSALHTITYQQFAFTPWKHGLPRGYTGQKKATGEVQRPEPSSLPFYSSERCLVRLYLFAFVPSTPAENASQPSPPQAPGEPLVGSKDRPKKLGESKNEESMGSAGP